MTNQEVEILLQESAVPCITIIIPMHRLSPDRIKDIRIVNDAVNQAKDILKQKFERSEYNIQKLVADIDELAESIDFVHSKDGVGIYISPNIKKMVKFNFPVEKKIKIDLAFDNRDLLYQQNTIIDYCVLSISQKYVHLYKGKGEDLTEILNEDFPITYEETYEYSKPTRGTSYSNNTLKEFEKDKSVMEEIRLVDFLKIADHTLDKYIDSNIPIIVSGGKKETADYFYITQHMKRIIGKVGSYNFAGEKLLANLAWQEVQRYQKNQTNIILHNLQELVGKKMLVSGLEDAWKAAQLGKGLELIVEKDFETNAFISRDGYDIKLENPYEKIPDPANYNYVNDAVERIIKIVREKKGKILFLDNGELENFKNIALQLRYNNS